MPFDPKGFIELSRSLNKPDLDEAQYRTAVSRALYGVFLWAREELDKRGQKVKVSKSDCTKGLGEEHGNVRRCFSSGKFSHAGVKERLRGLYRLRDRSDYELSALVTNNDLRQALEYVDYIEQAFDTILFKNTDQ